MLLETRSVEKPWGRAVLPPQFPAPAGAPVGEVWFVPPAQLDGVLVKYIFTSEKLSVQVHPSDAQTEAAGLGRLGKEECWLVIDAEPGAQLGIGLREDLAPEDLRAAALDGSIEQLLDWRPVRAGDFFAIPSGTVHAIGGGVSLVEVQQNRDTTYRLYDYGRPRELHLDRAVSVARAGPYDSGLHRRFDGGEAGLLIDGPHFRVDLVAGAPGAALRAVYDGALLIVPLEGEVIVEGETARAGQCAFAARLSDVEFGAARCLLVRPAD